MKTYEELREENKKLKYILAEIKKLLREDNDCEKEEVNTSSVNSDPNEEEINISSVPVESGDEEEDKARKIAKHSDFKRYIQNRGTRRLFIKKFFPEYSNGLTPKQLNQLTNLAKAIYDTEVIRF